MDWKGDQFIAAVEKKARRNVEAACIHVQNRARENISIPSRTVTYVQRANMGTGKGAGKVKKVLGKRGSNRSAPGEFPRKDFGTLRAGIAHQMKEGEPVGLVGTNVPHGKFLELGTRKMAPRPWLRRTLAEEKEVVVEIITTL